LNTLEVLKKSDLFRELNEEQIQKMLDMSTVKVFQPGEFVVKQGEKLEDIYVIKGGLIGIFIERGPLSQRQVQAAGVSDVLGWSSMIEPWICTAAGKALEKTTVISFNGLGLCSLCNINPSIGCRIMRGLARVISTRLRHSYEQLLGVSCQD